MPRTKKAEAAPSATTPAPLPAAGYVSVRRVANGYIVHSSTWDDDAEGGSRASYVFTSAKAAVARMTALLIPQPKPARAKRDPA